MFNFNVGRLTLQNCSYNAPKTDCKASELQSDGCIEWTQTKNHTNDLQTILCLLNGEWRTNTVMGSIFGCLYTMCMCLHSCKTDCLPLMWWRGKAMTEQQAENKIIKCCFSKQLSVISEHQTGNCTNGTAVKQTSHAICSSSPLSFSTVTPVCCWRLEDPSRENLDFHFHTQRQSVGEETGHCTGAQLVTRWRLQHPLIALHMQAWKHSHEARPSL